MPQELISLQNENGDITIVLDGGNAELTIGVNGQFGRLVVRDQNGTNEITLNGQAGTVSAESGRFRTLVSVDDSGTGQIGLNGNEATITVGFDEHGRVLIRNAQAQPTIRLEGGGGNIFAGGDGTDGDLVLFPSNVPNSANAQQATIHLNGQNGIIRVNGIRFPDNTLQTTAA